MISIEEERLAVDDHIFPMIGDRQSPKKRLG